MERNQTGNRESGPGNDRDLIMACCNLEQGAWEEFLAQYGKLIYYSIHRTCSIKYHKPEKDEIDDLFNDVLVHFIKEDCKNLRMYRGDEGCTVATWIRTVTVRFVIDHLRRLSRSATMVSLDSVDLTDEYSLTNGVSRPDKEYETVEKEARFEKAVSDLGEKDRYFMDLYYTRGLSPEEVAEVLGISVKTVYSRINRLKTKLSDAV